MVFVCETLAQCWFNFKPLTLSYYHLSRVEMFLLSTDLQVYSGSYLALNCSYLALNCRCSQGSYFELNCSYLALNCRWSQEVPWHWIAGVVRKFWDVKQLQMSKADLFSGPLGLSVPPWPFCTSRMYLYVLPDAWPASLCYFVLFSGVTERN